MLFSVMRGNYIKNTKKNGTGYCSLILQYIKKVLATVNRKYFPYQYYHSTLYKKICVTSIRLLIIFQQKKGTTEATVLSS